MKRNKRLKKYRSAASGRFVSKAFAAAHPQTTVTEKEPVDTSNISDGYHTFGELYAHRNALFILLVKLADQYPGPGYGKHAWKSQFSSDGSTNEGWFILGYGYVAGDQLSYHLPMSEWDACSFANTLESAPWDGHSSADVLSRLRQNISRG